MHVPATAIQQLQVFKSQPKFDPTDIYMGAYPVEIRPVLNAVLNQSADDFLAIIKAGATPEQYLQAMATGLGQIDPGILDTEDREQVAGQYMSLMDIVGLESSNGLLNSFVYGEALGNLLSENHKAE